MYAYRNKREYDVWSSETQIRKKMEDRLSEGVKGKDFRVFLISTLYRVSSVYIQIWDEKYICYNHNPSSQFCSLSHREPYSQSVRMLKLISL